MIKRFLKKVFNKITLRNYREQVLYEQKATRIEITRLYDQVFLNNPVMVINNVKMYLPLFYVDHIQKIIYQTHNFYEAETLEFLKLHYKKLDHIIDIGSNIGNHMLYYCSNLQPVKVHCFEPNPFNLEVLKKNIAINYLDKMVTAYPVALGAENGKGIQKNFTLDNTGMNRVDKLTDEQETGNAVDIRSLDDFHFSQVSFIKIDVEGFELEVLKGAEQTIKQSKPVVMVEVFESSRQNVDALMEQYGYKKFITLEQYNSLYVPL